MTTFSSWASRAAGRAWDSFSPAGVPPLARSNYRRELAAAMFLPFALTAFEGSVISVVARIAFEGRVGAELLNSVAALLAVVPAVANISSFIWVRLSHGIDKVVFIRRLQLGVVAMVFLMGFTPKSEAGLILLTLGVLGARTCWAGISTVRSTVWQANYPTGDRARITGRFAMLQVTLIGALALGLGFAMNADERAFRVMFPVGAALGLVGWWFWGGVRVRGHARLLREEQEGDKRDMPSFNPIAMVGVLLGDRRYSAFMGCQFLLGIGNITAMSLLPILLRERFDADYVDGLLVSTVIVLAMMPFSIPLWAKLLDRTHIVFFRAIHSWVFVGALGMLALAAWTGRFELLYIYAMLKGIGFGGGVLGWTLGHLDFAPPGRASLYMGVHVTLTGVRGVMAWLIVDRLDRYLFDREDPSTAAVLPAICLVVTLLGSIGFVAMSVFSKRGTPPGRPPGSPEPVPPARVAE